MSKKAEFLLTSCIAIAPILIPMVSSNRRFIHPREPLNLDGAFLYTSVVMVLSCLAVHLFFEPLAFDCIGKNGMPVFDTIHAVCPRVVSRQVV